MVVHVLIIVLLRLCSPIAFRCKLNSLLTMPSEATWFMLAVLQWPLSQFVRQCPVLQWKSLFIITISTPHDFHETWFWSYSCLSAMTKWLSRSRGFISLINWLITCRARGVCCITASLKFKCNSCFSSASVVYVLVPSRLFWRRLQVWSACHCHRYLVDCLHRLSVCFGLTCIFTVCMWFF